VTRATPGIPAGTRPAPVFAGHPLGEPRIVADPPGPRSRALAAALAGHEAPGISGFQGERPPIVWEAAAGSRVRDVDGNVYVDLTAGFAVAGVGHAHPRVVAAVARQAERLLHGMGDVFPHDARARLAQRLAALAPFDDARVYFASSGSEAVEIALKTAQLATGRASVAAFTGGYHGLSLGALRVTSRPLFRQPFEALLAPPTVWLPYPGASRAAPSSDPRAAAEVSLDACRTALAEAAARGTLPGALIVEPVLGREGVVVPPRGWLRALATLCRERGVLLIADEVFTGFGRTGRRFAVDVEDVSPDVLVVGKGMAGGLPIGAALAPAELFEVWRTEGEALHTSTFLAHPLACAAALAALDVFEEEGLVERAAAWGRRWRDELPALAGGAPGVADVRGAGMMWGIELCDVRGEPAARRAARVVHECRRRGLLLLAGGPGGNVLQITPPLVLEEGEWAFARAVLEASLHGSL
jgi:4-aminobutyrate aminotransferase-like enzyme